MIVCHCHGVSEHTIRAAVREGATNRSEVVRTCAAGRTCGGCGPVIDEIVEHEIERHVQAPLLGVVELATG